MKGKAGRENGGKGVTGDFAGAGSAGLEAAELILDVCHGCFVYGFGDCFSILGLLAVLTCFVLSWQSGLGMLIVVWLVSPLGIPLAAAWALGGLEKLEGWLVERIYH